MVVTTVHAIIALGVHKRHFCPGSSSPLVTPPGCSPHSSQGAPVSKRQVPYLQCLQPSGAPASLQVKAQVLPVAHRPHTACPVPSLPSAAPSPPSVHSAPATWAFSAPPTCQAQSGPGAFARAVPPACNALFRCLLMARFLTSSISPVHILFFSLALF